MKKSTFMGLLGVAFFGMGSSLSAQADAQVLQQVADCPVTGVAYVNDQLIISCSGHSDVQAFGPSFSTCGQHQSSDTMKVFVSVAQAAFLSGHHLTINYYARADTTCVADALIYLRMF